MAKHIFVSGSPGSGKSVFSAALAKASSNRDKKTIIVSGDYLIPMLPFFCGDTDTIGLGSLCKHEITPQSIADAVKVLKAFPNIGVIGMQPNDDIMHITLTQILSIKKCLDSMVDIVIWDGTSEIGNYIDLLMRGLADLHIYILTADVKGILYYDNYRHIITEKDNSILLEGLAKTYTAADVLSLRTGGLYGRLYYGREIERICMEGDIFTIDEVCHSSYREITEKMIELVLMGKEE